MTGNSDSTQPLNWLREDMREVREALIENTKTLGELAGKVDDYSDALDIHSRDCPARNRKLSSTTIAPPMGFGVLKVLQRWSPLIAAIGMGLLALGAYFGQASTMEKRIEKIQAAVDVAVKATK